MNLDEVSAELRRIRLARGWSLVEVARRAGTSAPTVHRYENGWRHFELFTLAKLATALGARLGVTIEPIERESRATRTTVTRRIRRLFWDHDLRPSDLTRHPRWVVQRVLEYGNLEDVRLVRRYFGRSAFLDLVEQMHFGSKKTRRFWERILNCEGRECTRRFSREEAERCWNV
jgi:transcriptional regulator with XRE-family HTH domain